MRCGKCGEVMGSVPVVVYSENGGLKNTGRINHFCKREDCGFEVDS